MIGKISKGATFHGCVKYAMGKDEAKLLVAEGVLIGTVKEISDSFEMQRAATNYKTASRTHRFEL